MVPWYHGNMAPWYHGTTEPWCHGTMVAWSHDSMVVKKPPSVIDYEIMLVSFWDHVGVMLWSVWGQFGVSLGSCWGHFGVMLGHFGSVWKHRRIILVSFWEQSGRFLKSFWGCRSSSKTFPQGELPNATLPHHHHRKPRSWQQMQDSTSCLAEQYKGMRIEFECVQVELKIERDGGT